MSKAVRWVGRVCWLLVAIPGMALAQVDLQALDRDMAGPRTQVLVLGTLHLKQMDPSPQPASLDALLDRLARFRPDLITIEALPGEECELAARLPDKYGTDYCASTAQAQTATGLHLPDALGAVAQTLKTWPSQPTTAQRRRLAALFLAANDRASALVQWLQLPASERHADDGLSAELVALLGTLAADRNENYQIAARLAARLGLQRVHPVDNHTGDNADVADMHAFGRAVEQAWNAGRQALDAQTARQHALARAPDLLPLYRHINLPENLQVLADVNVRAALRAESPQRYPQIWVGGWEVRNLRMVANIREVFRERPGARVLAIVGASHKPWFDDWLGQLQGVDIVDVGAALE